MTQVIPCILQKGGCGKTTTTVNTVGYLSMQGLRVLCVDMDPQGNLTQHFGYDAESLEKTILDLFQKSADFEDVVLKRNDLHFAEEFVRDHHKTVEKRDYYQKKYDSLSQQEKNQIIMFAKKNLSTFVKEFMELNPEKLVFQQALLVERNNILEKLFPYRANVLIELGE